MPLGLPANVEIVVWKFIYNPALIPHFSTTVWNFYPNNA